MKESGRRFCCVVLELPDSFRLGMFRLSSYQALGVSGLRSAGTVHAAFAPLTAAQVIERAGRGSHRQLTPA